MGGKAFSAGPSPLSTPRMPPEIYYKLRDQYHRLLARHFEKVVTPIEAPSKSSYGDIDFLVAGPTFSTSQPHNEFLSQVLSAERVAKMPQSGAASYAVPYPNAPNHCEWVQIDVHICPLPLIDWHIFHQSHGDLWNLLGTTIRPFGLTANDKGLHLRIAEIEGLNRKKSMLLLTDEPDKVLALLDLDAETYRKPFETVEALYEYTVCCRFFRRETYKRDGLKANDRKRMAQRDLYRQFVDEWLPDNDSGIKARVRTEQALTREDVIELVLDTFDKRVEYDRRIVEWRSARMELLAKQGNREERKAYFIQLEEYANAWITWLGNNG